MKDNSSVPVALTDNVYIDCLLGYARWVGSSISFAFPTSASNFPDTWPWNTRPEIFLAAPTDFQTNVTYWLSQVSSFTQLTFVSGNAATSTLRWGLATDFTVSAGANMPDNSSWAGDMYFSFMNYSSPKPGGPVSHIIAHELGHALGLKHSFDGSPISPLNRDSNEYTVMSYRQSVQFLPGTGILNGGTSSPDEYSQTYMTSDIAALQQLYGANFAFNSSDSVYRFDPTSGQMFVNGQAQDPPSGAKVYRTIWDGGGNDTYDLSSFAQNQQVDLTPGGWTTFSSSMLGGGFYGLDAQGNRLFDPSGNGMIFTAPGNIANALLYQSDVRALIENALTGSGNDTIIGNQADNIFDGGSGTDTAVFSGPSSKYRLTFANGKWTVQDKTGADGTDTLINMERLQFANKTIKTDSKAPGSYTDLPESLWHFCIVAFSAAPGVEYMNQMADAYRSGLSVQTIVDIFTSKNQFTDVYPTNLSHVDLASALVKNVVKGSASLVVKQGAINDIVAALDIGWTVGEMIYTVFGNLAGKPLDDPTWGNTAHQFQNEMAVAKYYTNIMGQSTTDLSTLRQVLAPVDQNTDVSTTDHIATLIGMALMA